MYMYVYIKFNLSFKYFNTKKNKFLLTLKLFENKNGEEYSSNFSHVINALPSKIIIDRTTSCIEGSKLYLKIRDIDTRKR